MTDDDKRDIKLAAAFVITIAVVAIVLYAYASALWNG